jgi:TonB family protein
MQRVLAVALSLVATMSFANPTPDTDKAPLPRSIKCPAPSAMDVPAAVVRAGTQGLVVVELTVAESNQIAGLKVVKSSGVTREHKLLDRYALSTFEKCKWQGPSDVAPGVYTVSYQMSIQ